MSAESACIVGPHPHPKGHFFGGKKCFNSSSPLPWAPQATPSPSLAPESLSDASTMLDHSTGQALFMSPGSDRHNLLPTEGVSTALKPQWVAQEELEEGGI